MKQGRDREARGAIVLGGSSPIGAAIGKSFADDGDQTFCIAREAPPGGAFLAHVEADCGDPAIATRAVEAARQVLGRLDVVVLAAASMPVAVAGETTDEQWSRCLSDSLSSAFYVLRACLPTLPSGSAIVTVGSVNSFLAAPGLAAYAAAKAGLDGLMRQLALDYGPRGIRVNAVAPGLVSSGEAGPLAAGYPLGRVGTPEDVAEAVRFLASPASSFITGVVLPVDGGLSIASPAAFLRPDLQERFPRNCASAGQ